MATPTFSSWIERIVQLLHDPPGKIRYLARHEALAKKPRDGRLFDENKIF